MAHLQWTCLSARFGLLLVRAILAGILCLAASRTAVASSDLQLIEAAPDGRGFIERDSKRPYVPFGTNYYDPHTGWAPKLWKKFDAEKVRQHFQIMRELGVNCARLFLTAGSFQPQADSIEEAALEKLDALVKIARRTRIRLILTGPDHWEGVPSYWRPDRFAGDTALAALERFWSVVGHRYQGEPAVFAWDLLNEPHLPWSSVRSPKDNEQWRGKWNAWLKKKYGTVEALRENWAGKLTEQDAWGDVAVPENQPDAGNPRLRDWQRFREHLADQWVRRQVEALRTSDPSHLVTVGYIQWSYPLVRPGPAGRYSAFNPRRQARWLDFVTIHFYPTMGDPLSGEKNWRKNLSYLQAVLAYCHVGKPVVLGEYGWYGGGAPQHHPHLTEQQQAQWLSAEIEASGGLASGWLSWPFADTPESGDISKFGGLVRSDLAPKAWGRKFKELAADVTRLKRPPVAPPVFDFSRALTADQKELATMHRAYVEAVRQKLSQNNSPTPPAATSK
jgi:hypothetical protein